MRNNYSGWESKQHNLWSEWEQEEVKWDELELTNHDVKMLTLLSLLFLLFLGVAICLRDQCFHSIDLLHGKYLSYVTLEYNVM